MHSLRLPALAAGKICTVVNFGLPTTGVSSKPIYKHKIDFYDPFSLYVSDLYGLAYKKCAPTYFIGWTSTVHHDHFNFNRADSRINGSPWRWIRYGVKSLWTNNRILFFNHFQNHFKIVASTFGRSQAAALRNGYNDDLDTYMFISGKKSKQFWKFGKAKKYEKKQQGLGNQARRGFQERWPGWNLISGCGLDPWALPSSLPFGT